jgi:hypothetical protein
MSPLLTSIGSTVPSAFEALCSENGLSDLQIRVLARPDVTIFSHFRFLQSLRLQAPALPVKISDTLPVITGSCLNLRVIVLHGLAATSHDLALLSRLKLLKRIGIDSIKHEFFETFLSTPPETEESALAACRQLAGLLPPSVGIDLHVRDGRLLVPIIYLLAKTLSREAWLSVVKAFNVDLNADLIDEERTLSHELFLLKESAPNANKAFFWALEEDLVDLRRFNFFLLLNVSIPFIDEKRANWIVTTYLDRACKRYNVPEMCLLMDSRHKTVLMFLMAMKHHNLAHPSVKVIFDSLLDRKIFSIDHVDVDGNTLAHHMMLGAPEEDIMLANMEQLYLRGFDFNTRNRDGSKFFHCRMLHQTNFNDAAIERYGLQIMPEDLSGYLTDILRVGKTALLESLLPFAEPSHFLPDENGIPPFLLSFNFGDPKSALLLLAQRQRLGIDVNQGCIVDQPHRQWLPSFAGQTIFTPLSVCIITETVSALEALLQAGADVTRIYDGGNTLLHIAAMHCQNQEIFEILLNHLGSQNAQLVVQPNDDGHTPYSLIKQKIDDGDDAAPFLGMALSAIRRFCEQHHLQL